MHALLRLEWQEPSPSATILMGLLAVPGMLFQDSAKYVDLLAPITFASAPSPIPWTFSLIPPGSHPCVRAQVSQAQGFTPLTTPGAGAGALSLFSLTLFLRLCFFEISFD